MISPDGPQRHPETLADVPWIRIFPVRTPTLPPATHTNVYFFGRGEVMVVDPASPFADEQNALDRAIDDMAKAGERVTLVVLTHHHVDHVSGARHLADRLGVPVAAHPETARRLSGAVACTRTIEEGEQLAYGPAGLFPLFTPGHAPGHLCFRDPSSAAVLVGDMVASIGTIVVEPDDGGDMALYLDSLRRLRNLEATWLLPSHGQPIRDAAGHLDFYLAHRLERESRVAAALEPTGQTVAEMVPRVYRDIAPALYPLAARSLLAHLIKLQGEGRATCASDQRWSYPDTSRGDS